MIRRVQRELYLGRSKLVFPAVRLGGLHHVNDVVAGATVSCEERRCLIITNDFLSSWIPLDRTPQSASDRRQMASRHSLDVGENVRHREAAFANTLVKIAFVIASGFAFEKTRQVFFTELALVPIFFDRLALNCASANEDASLRALEQNAIVATAVDHHFDAVFVFALNREIV